MQPAHVKVCGDVFRADLLAIGDLPRLLGLLDYVCGECARLVSGI